jgi:hypothetical protein
MIHEESEDMSFKVSHLEKNMGNMEQRMEKKLDESLEKNMGNMEKRMEKLEEGMDKIVNLIQHTEEKIPNGDNVGQGTHDDRNSSHFEQPSFSKHTLGGFDSNTGSNHAWFLLTRVKIPRNKGRHYPFRKSQLDSRTYGMVGSMRLWTHYHYKFVVWCALKLKNNKRSQLSESKPF